MRWFFGQTRGGEKERYRLFDRDAKEAENGFRIVGGERVCRALRKLGADTTAGLEIYDPLDHLPDYEVGDGGRNLQNSFTRLHPELVPLPSSAVVKHRTVG